MPEKGGVETLEKVPGAFCKWNSEKNKQTKKSMDVCLLFPLFLLPSSTSCVSFFAPGTFLNYEGFMKSYE